MKKLTGALALGLAFQMAMAGGGKITFKWGNEYKLPKKHLDAGFIGNSTDGYTQIGHAYGKDLSLQHFDPKLNLVSTKMNSLKSMPKGYMSESWLTTTDNRTFWLYTTWDKKSVTERLFCQEINLKTSEFKGDSRELITVNGKVTGVLVMTGFYKFNTADKYNVVTSFDGKRVLIYYRRRPEEKRDKLNKDKIGYSVYDENMKQLYAYETEMPYTEEMMDNVDYQVDGKGNIYLLARVYDKAAEGHKAREYHFEILKWTQDQKKASVIPVSVSQKYIREVNLLEDKKGELIVAGYYANSLRSSGVDGVFMQKLNPEGTAMGNIFKSYYEFPAEVLKEFESDRTKKKMDKKENKDDLVEDNLRLRNVTVRDDGSIELWGEQYYVVTYVVMTNSGTQTRRIYHYDDVIGCRINADGELAYVRKVPKNQEGNNNFIGLGIKEYNYGDDSYVLFLDNMKNVDIKPSQAPAKHMAGLGGVLMAVKVDSKGVMTKQKVFDVREEKMQLQPTNFDDVGNNQIIARGTKGVLGGGPSKPALITFE